MDYTENPFDTEGFNQNYSEYIIVLFLRTDEREHMDFTYWLVS